MDYVYNMLRGLNRLFSTLFVHSDKEDQMYSYIVAKSKSGPKGVYIYSNPKDNVYYNYAKR